MKWGPDRWRLYRLALGEAGRALVGTFAGLFRPPRFLRSGPRRLLLAPQELRTADPTIASDIYGGRFVFAGRAVTTAGRSPFEIDPPSPAWAEVLYGFGWLRHLRSADTALARANARALVNEFMSRGRDGRAIVRATPVAARRLLSFLAHSPLLLNGAERGFYQRFLRAIDHTVRDLEWDMGHAPQALDRLIAALALSYVGLCCEGYERLFWRARRHLARELDGQILADGGHRGRNPQVVVELLLDLLPLRQAFASRSLEPPPEMASAIDRMLPLLRLLRLGDGSLGHFNGMGRTAADLLATLLMYEAARGQAMRRAPRSGYERLEAGNTAVIAEVGPAPAVDCAADAHAGCLSFEMSSGTQPLVVNCGAARGAKDETRLAARSTAAHSTATVAETSSGRFLARQGWFLERWLAAWLMRRFDHALVRGPEAVAAERQEEQEGERPMQILRARHDGYRRLGLLHERAWRLSGAGERLEGEDAFTRQGAQRGALPVAIRFHLAPGVRASRVEGGDAVVLLLPNREAWQFGAEGAEPSLEESVFFAASDGLRRTEQIVLFLDAAETPRVRWRFERLPRGGEREAVRRRGPDTSPLL